MSLFIDIDLPKGCLLTGDTPAPVVEVGDLGATYFTARDLGETWNGARPAKPNTGNARADTVAGRAVMVTTDGINCGFAAEGITVGHSVSVAILFHRFDGARAGTLFTLNPQDGRDYLFLSGEGGEVRLATRDGDSDLTLPLSAAPFDMVLCQADQTGVQMAVNGGAPVKMAHAGTITGGLCDLFIACRSDRAGIKKTLGHAAIADLWLWPQTDIFAPDQGAKRAALWQFQEQVNAHGI